MPCLSSALVPNKIPEEMQCKAGQCITHHRVFGRVHVILHANILPEDDPDSPYAYFGIDQDLTYYPLLDEFGPMNLLMIHKFKCKLDAIIQRNPHRSTAMWVGHNAESRTNAALFLGAYMVMNLNFSPVEAEKRLAPLCAIAFRDVLPPSTSKESVIWRVQSEKRTVRPACVFKLNVRDCLEALLHAKGLRWLRLSEFEAADEKTGICSGTFDPVEYEFLDNPLNADLHEVVGFGGGMGESQPTYP